MKGSVLDRNVLAIINVVLLVYLLHVVVSVVFCISTFCKYSRRILLAISTSVPLTCNNLTCVISGFYSDAYWNLTPVGYCATTCG